MPIGLPGALRQRTALDDLRPNYLPARPTQGSRLTLIPSRMGRFTHSIAKAALIAIVVVVSTWHPRAAQAIDPDKGLRECTVETWATRDGLPGAWIRGILQTPDGYLWLGTQGGLVRYGGGPLFHLRPASSSDPASDVMGLDLAADGTIWITPARGPLTCVRNHALVDCLQPATQTPSPSPSPSSSAMPPDMRVNALHIERGTGGAVWVASARGIERIAGSAPPQLVFPPAAIEKATVTALHVDPQRRLWVGTSAGLFLARGDSATPTIARHEEEDASARASLQTPVTSLHETPRGELWVATEHALHLLREGRTVTRYTEREGLPPARLTEVMEDRDGNLWVGSRAGLLRLSRGRPPALFTRAHGLPDEDISALFEDREGSLWVGTRAGGMAQFTDRSLSTQQGPPSMREAWVNSVAEGPDGALWVGSHRGLTRWKDGQERTYQQADGLPGVQVRTLLPAADGTVWVGTDKGLGRWRQEKLDEPVRLDAPVSSLLLEDDGTLWLGTDSALFRLTAGGKLQRLPLAPELANEPLSEIRSIARDDGGVLWISAGGRLLRVLDAESSGNQTIGRDRGPERASFGRVRGLHRDARGTLWLGTGDGLVRRRQGGWRMFGPAEGLTVGDLYQVITDDVGHLWATSYRGLLRISLASLENVASGRGQQLQVVSFEASDQQRDVAATRTRQPASWKGRDGQLWFASGRGVVRVDPRRLRLNQLPPPVFIEQAVVDGRPARRGAGNHFPAGSGALEFHFAAITLIEPRKTRYRYRLEGFDSDWVDAGARRVAYYTNIAAGRYRFLVQGSNADGIWNHNGDVISFSLAPHFFRTGWFYTLLGLMVAGLAFSFHRMRLLQLRARYAATYAERSRVARELHDSLLQGMAATLMRLRALGKRFINGQEASPPEAVAGEIREIEQVVASNIEETRRFVWDLREEGAAPPELGRALEDLALRMAGTRSAEARVVVEGATAPVPVHVRRELLRVAHEALANALTHGGARLIEVHLQYGGAGGGLRLTVSDDGRGFDPQRAAGAESGHFGLQGMRERAASLGTFSVESRPGGGTRVEVQVNRRELARHD